MPRSDLVGSVLKALDLLSLTSRSPDGLRLNELAAAAGLRKTTAHNLLRTLRARGFVEKDAAQRFVPGPAVGELARGRLRRTLEAEVERHFRGWQRRYPEMVLTFSELTPGAILCRLRMSPDRPGEVQRPQDRFFPAYGSATAICLQTTAVNAPLFERHFPFGEHGVGLWSDAAAWQEEKRRVRQAGYCLRNKGERLAVAFAVPENYALGFSGDHGVGIGEMVERLCSEVEGFRAALAEAANRGEMKDADDVDD